MNFHEQRRSPSRPIPPPLPSPVDGVAYAQQCVSDVRAGVRKYKNEMPEVQSLLCQLVKAIDALRTPHTDASQQTLQAVLAKQASSAAATTEFHSMATGHTTPAGGEPQPPAEEAEL